MGIVGDGIQGYGCPPMSPIACGLIHMELNRGDGSLGTFLGVQAGLAMQSIAMLGSEEQKQRWLRPMAQLNKIGAFALTEPTHGSDSVALETTARRDGDTWMINGAKKWIGNGTIADVIVVWARDVADRQVKGFLVEKGTPGLSGPKDRRQGLVAGGLAGRDRRSPTSGSPSQTGCPARTAFKDTGRVLAGTRNAVAWARARACHGRVRGRRCRTAASARSSANRWSASRSCRRSSSRCSPRCARCSCTACGSAG